jgi:hypothetical protein
MPQLSLNLCNFFLFKRERKGNNLTLELGIFHRGKFYGVIVFCVEGVLKVNFLVFFLKMEGQD